MYPVIHRYDDQAFDDMNEQSEKKLNHQETVQSRDIVEPDKKKGKLRPKRGTAT